MLGRRGEPAAGLGVESEFWEGRSGGCGLGLVLQMESGPPEAGTTPGRARPRLEGELTKRMGTWTGSC